MAYGVAGNTPLENYEIVRRVAAEKGDSDVVTAQQSLESLLNTRAKVMNAKADVQAAVIAQLGAENDLGACEQEVKEFRDAARNCGLDAQDGEGADDGAYSKQFDDIKRGDMGRLMSDINDYTQSQSEKNELYADYDSSDSLDEFRHDLLKHLAGNIVVKEHRIRYQKEQFDRFLASLHFWELKKSHYSLKEFSKAYSKLIEATTKSSHNYCCHKIDANYDDFGEQTVRPLNATIFFYFFSANRSGKTWA